MGERKVDERKMKDVCGTDVCTGGTSMKQLVAYLSQEVVDHHVTIKV